MKIIETLQLWRDEEEISLSIEQLQVLSKYIEGHYDGESTLNSESYGGTDYAPKIYTHEHERKIKETKQNYEDKIRDRDETIKDLKRELMSLRK